MSRPAKFAAVAIAVAAAAIPAAAPAASAAKPISLPAAYPEGPAVIGRTLYWAEMPKDRVRAFDGKRVRTVFTSPGCGPTAVRPTRAGDIWILCHLGGKVLLLDSRWHLKKEVDYTTAGVRITWPNDGKVDSAGNIYLSSSGIFDVEAEATGTLVRVSPDGTAVTLAGPFHYTNGVSLNAAGNLLFLSEHLARRIWAITLKNGQVVDKKIFFDFAAAGLSKPAYPEAGPDGQWLAPSGDLYVAEYGGGRIIHMDRNGHLKGVFKVPTPYVTNMVPSPFHAGRLMVTGTFDNRIPSMPGQVFEIPQSF